jgi:hypothetical protein
MSLKEINFTIDLDRVEGSRKNGRLISEANKGIFLKILDDIRSESPQLKPVQAKSIAIELFLGAAGFDVRCIESIQDNLRGIMIYHKESLVKVGFIVNNSQIPLQLGKMYFDGVLEKAKITT